MKKAAALISILLSSCPAVFGQDKTGEALIRPPVTHSDEALDDVEAILVEIKQ